MAQGEGFKHITVTAPEDDDVVIIAGAVSDEEPASSENLQDPAETDGPELQSEVTAPEPVKPAKPVKPTKSAKPKTDAYHETTLEDLESTPMPLAQRIVIVAAIVCIIGAVIYCTLFMG